MPALGIIPARYASTRFPGKPLALIAGKPMIQWVYEGAQACKALDQVIVAADDERILNAVATFGGKAMWTSPAHSNGTERIAEVAQHYPHHELILNIQGDEPLVESDVLSQLLASFKTEAVQIATAARLIDNEEVLFSPHVVKVVKGQDGRAHYFSRNAIPHLRDQPRTAWLAAEAHFQHLGLYAYRREILLAIAKLPPAPLEQLESLEQLRWLEAGYAIYCVETQYQSIGVDTPADIAKVERFLK